MKKDELLSQFEEFEINNAEKNNIRGGALVGSGGVENPTSGCNTGDTYCHQDGAQVKDDCDCDWTDDPPKTPVAIANPNYPSLPILFKP